MPKLEERDRSSCGEAFKRAINYYKKKAMYDDAIFLAQYSIDHKLLSLKEQKDLRPV